MSFTLAQIEKEAQLSLEREPKGARTHIMLPAREMLDIIATLRRADADRKVWAGISEKLSTISVRANTYGPGFPPTYADALWSLAREAEAALAAMGQP